jgi:hypothetical protein
MARRSSGQETAMNDMLSNIALGFIMLFIIAVMMMNPITKKNDVPSKNEFMILMEWDPESIDDVDMWVQYKDESPVGFSNRNSGWVNLDRDDLGQAGDSILIDGKYVDLKINRETTNLRGIRAGDYYVVAHMYNRRDPDRSNPQQVKIIVIDINPYKEVYTITMPLNNTNDVARFPAFTVDEQGKVVAVFNHTRNIIPKPKGTTQ